MNYYAKVNPRKAPGQKRKNAGLSLLPGIINLLDAHRGTMSKSQYAERILLEYFRKKEGRLNPDERASLGRESL